MKKWFYLLNLMFFPCLAFAAPLDFQSDIMNKLKIPSYSSEAKPSGYTVSLNYILPSETCLRCIVSFFEEKLSREGWELEKTKEYNEPLLESFMDFRNKLIEVKKQNQGALPPGADAQTAEYVMSVDPEKIREKIRQMAPMVVSAEKPKDKVRCQIYIQPNSIENNIELIITFSQAK